MSQQNNMKNIEKNLENMKNMLNVSLADILIPDIKSHKNENVTKMLDVVKDKPEMYLSLLMVSIFHKNKKIVEIILNKYFTSEIEDPFINSQFLYNAILPENSKNKLTDPKNNYLEEICPYSVMAGIGGDIDIFQILYKKNLINNYNINNTGIIGLTKKYKNIFCSNIIGACAYYGNDKLLEFILNNYRQFLDININTTEKKSKNSKIHFSKEFSNYSPIFLGIVGNPSDKKILEILKIFEESRANFESKDFNENNIIHIATKEKKILSLKFLVESLGLKNIINENNLDNETPYIVAQKIKNKEVIDFLEKNLNEDKDIIEKTMEELINEDNKRKNKKKNKKDEFHLLNSNEYEETLGFHEEKLEGKKDEENNNNNELNEINENNFSDKEEEKEGENEEIEEKVKNKRSSEYYDYKNKSKRKNNKYNYTYNKKYENYNTNDYNAYTNYDKYTYSTSVKYNQYNNKYYNNNNNYENNYEYNNYYNDDFYNSKNNWENKKGKRGKYNNIESKNKKDLYQKKYKSKGLAVEVNMEGDNNINKEDDNYDNNIDGIKVGNIEIKSEIQQNNEKNNEEMNNNNKPNLNTNINHNNESLITKKEEEKNNSKEEEEEEEYSYSEEDFLSHHSEKKEEKRIEILEYNELLKKYIEIERRVNELEKEKKELNKCIKKIYLDQYKNKQNIPNTEQNINSLLALTNNELEKKDNLIAKLKKETKMADLSDIKNFEKDKLKEYKNFYNKNLKIINDILKKNEK